MVLVYGAGLCPMKLWGSMFSMDGLFKMAIG